PIPADGHAAPSSSAAASAIDEEKRAGGTLACLHLREVLPADQVSHGARNWEQQSVGRAPAPLESPGELRVCLPVVTIEGDNLSDCFATGEHAVQGLEFSQCALPQRPALVLPDESAEPSARGPRLRRHGIELSRNGALPQACTR